MVHVVHPSYEEKIISAVVYRGLDELPRDVSPHGQDVRIHKQSRQHQRKHIGENVVERVCVLRRKSHRCGEHVVSLMETMV